MTGVAADDARRETSSSPRSPGAITLEDIRDRAYELWERNHKPEGFEIEFWLLAERELRTERARKKPEVPPSGAAD